MVGSSDRRPFASCASRAGRLSSSGVAGGGGQHAARWRWPCRELTLCAGESAVPELARDHDNGDGRAGGAGTTRARRGTRLCEQPQAAVRAV
jgi:hypothetical protein